MQLDIASELVIPEAIKLEQQAASSYSRLQVTLSRAVSYTVELTRGAQVTNTFRDVPRRLHAHRYTVYLLFV